MKKIFLVFLIVLSVFVFFYPHNFVLANTDTGLVSADCAGENPENCNFNSLVETAVNILEWILAVMSVAAFLYFIYGGFIFLTSGGSSQRVEKGKSILLNTLIGIIIILGAFTFIRYIGDILLQGKTDNYDMFLDTGNKNNRN